jgi:hypothetical protein
LDTHPKHDVALGATLITAHAPHQLPKASSDIPDKTPGPRPAAQPSEPQLETGQAPQDSDRADESVDSAGTVAATPVEITETDPQTPSTNAPTAPLRLTSLYEKAAEAEQAKQWSEAVQMSQPARGDSASVKSADLQLGRSDSDRASQSTPTQNSRHARNVSRLLWLGSILLVAGATTVWAVAAHDTRDEARDSAPTTPTLGTTSPPSDVVESTKPPTERQLLLAAIPLSIRKHCEKPVQETRSAFSGSSDLSMVDRCP